MQIKRNDSLTAFSTSQITFEKGVDKLEKFRWLPSKKVDSTPGYILKVERAQIGPWGREK